MAAPLVDCPEHGIVPGVGVGFSGGATFISVNSSAQCSVCGRPSMIIDGSYADHGDHVHADLVFTAEQLGRLRVAVQMTLKAQPPDPIKPIAEISPELGDAISKAVESGLERGTIKRKSKNRRKLTLGVLGALGTLLATDYSVVGDNVEAVRFAIAQLLQYVAVHGAVPPPWG